MASPSWGSALDLYHAVDTPYHEGLGGMNLKNNFSNELMISDCPFIIFDILEEKIWFLINSISIDDCNKYS